ncbi:MAG: 50S ribosomal protein L27 [bacterium]|nr:50S ribosomal protein L27 [bacterium]
MAHTKSSGSAKYGRDSQPKYLGIKKQDGERVKIGDILIRQRGSKYLAGKGVKVSKDDTIFSLVNGLVKFTVKRKIRFDGTTRRAPMISVFPEKN